MQTYPQGVKIGYGIRNYKGKNSFYQDDKNLGIFNFKISHEKLTNTGLILKITSRKLREIEKFNIQYIAVDRSLIYHLNVFNSIEFLYDSSKMTAE